MTKSSDHKFNMDVLGLAANGFDFSGYSLKHTETCNVNANTFPNPRAEIVLKTNVPINFIILISLATTNHMMKEPCICSNNGIGSVSAFLVSINPTGTGRMLRVALNGKNITIWELSASENVSFTALVY